MTDETLAPNPKELDLVALFTGMAYPTETVDVFLNAEIGYKAYRLQNEMSRLATLEDSEGLKAAEAEYDALVEQSAQYKYTVHLRGTSRETRNNIRASIEKEFPAETDILGRPKPNPLADVAFENRIWQAHVERIEGPAGTLNAPTEEAIAYFRGNAPDAASDAVSQKIVELSQGTAEGFESIVKSADFLSQP